MTVKGVVSMDIKGLGCCEDMYDNYIVHWKYVDGKVAIQDVALNPYKHGKLPYYILGGKNEFWNDTTRTKTEL